MSKLKPLQELLETLAAAVPLKRTDLPTKAYHGTNKTFSEFKEQPVGFMLDRGLGTHVAKDPALASSMADRWIKDEGPDYFSRWTKKVVGEPQVYPLQIPAESKFLQLDQPADSRVIEGLPHWKNIMHDEHAVERAMASAVYPKNEDLLAKYLMDLARFNPQEAAAAARELAKGGTTEIAGKQYDLPGMIRNWGGKPMNDADRAAITADAKKHWQDQGHAGIRYTNTASQEAGAPGVTDPTSYIVFDPKNIRSQFAKFDPRKMSSADLLASLTGLAGTGVAAGAVRQQGQQ